MKKIFNGLEYKIETIEDHLTDTEIKYMTGVVKRKEVKKVKYLEVKVVKVKKCKHETNNMAGNHRFYCGQCGTEIKNVKPKGNWVNNENLDKIKFPCFCSYNGKYFGIIYIDKEGTFGLINIDKQREKWCTEDNGWHNLNNMIKSYNIHILKGKIILFEEE